MTHLSTETIQQLPDIAQAAQDNSEHSDTELLQCRNRKLHLKFHWNILQQHTRIPLRFTKNSMRKEGIINLHKM